TGSRSGLPYQVSGENGESRVIPASTVARPHGACGSPGCVPNDANRHADRSIPAALHEAQVGKFGSSRDQAMTTDNGLGHLRTRGEPLRCPTSLDSTGGRIAVPRIARFHLTLRS